MVTKRADDFAEPDRGVKRVDDADIMAALSKALRIDRDDAKSAYDAVGGEDEIDAHGKVPVTRHRYYAA